MLRDKSAADQDYIEYLWYLMHHRENGDEAMTFLTSYYDDSGSDDLSPVTAIGGPVMLKEACIAFNTVWLKLLEQYRVFGPLHMTDFVRPYGKHIGMHFELKLALFSEIARLINEHKVYSVSVGIPQPDFRAAMPEEVRKELIGPYALAFFCAVMINQGVARLISDKETVVMAYLVDHGSSHADQLLAAHGLLQKREAAAGGFRHTAAIGFDTDDRVSALQAADVIAWCARKRQISGALTKEFEPLNEVLAEIPAIPARSKRAGGHQHIVIPQEGIEMWAKPIRNWISVTGQPPLRLKTSSDRPA